MSDLSTLPLDEQSRVDVDKKRKQRLRSIREIPGPRAYPLIGTSWTVGILGNYSMDDIHLMYKGNTFFILSRVMRSIDRSIDRWERERERGWCVYNHLINCPNPRADMKRKYGPVVKQESFFNFAIISLFSRADIESILRRSSRYPLRPAQEVIVYYRQSRTDRYINLGLVNELVPTNYYKLSIFTHSRLSSLFFIPE